MTHILSFLIFFLLLLCAFEGCEVTVTVNGEPNIIEMKFDIIDDSVQPGQEP